MVKAKLLLTLLPLAFCTGCMQFELSAEELMRPPALTQEQLEISTALERAVGDSNIKYKYPETGEHRSSFLFYDLDDDGQDEALIFYQAASKGSATWMNILDKQDDHWVSVFDISAPNQETEVDFISFQPLLEEGSIVIGWADEYMNEKSAVVYTYDGTVLTEVYEDDYDFLSFTDLNKDNKLDMITVVSDPFYEESTVSFITEDSDITGKHILERKDILELPYGSAEIVSVQSGFTDVITPAIFIDSNINISRNETAMVSQVVSASGDELVNLLDSDDSETRLSESTIRPTSTLCQDINGDGFIEIPSVSALPGYEEEEEVLYLTTFNRLGVGHSLLPATRCVINEDHRYLLEFPERWLDKVTIISQPETNEWSFIRYNGTLEDSSALLLRLKVYSVKDYHDKFESETFKLLGRQGLFEYYAHIPENSDELAITSLELDRFFEFLE